MSDSYTAWAPLLSAIVIIPDTYQTVARTMQALQKQTAASRMEIVFIVPASAAVDVPPDAVVPFWGVQTVTVSNLTVARALAQGVRKARAVVVAFTEDHAFPAPNWAERLVHAHQKPFAAVGPAMRNADPSSLVSCADFYMGYGKWAEPIDSGVFDFLMEHNSSYKRDLLLAYGARLDAMLESETVMQFDLSRRGHTFWLEGTTYTAHTCFGRWRPWLAASLWHARSFAAHRSATWSFARRMLYTVTAPLLPFLRINRIRHSVARGKWSPGARIKLYGALLIGLAFDAVGESLGYVLGAGDTSAQSVEHEFHRERHLGPISSKTAE